MAATLDPSDQDPIDPSTDRRSIGRTSPTIGPAPWKAWAAPGDRGFPVRKPSELGVIRIRPPKQLRVRVIGFFSRGQPDKTSLLFRERVEVVRLSMTQPLVTMMTC